MDDIVRMTHPGHPGEVITKTRSEFDAVWSKTDVPWVEVTEGKTRKGASDGE